MTWGKDQLWNLPSTGYQEGLKGPTGCSQPSLQLGAGSSISAIPHTHPQAPVSRRSALNVLDLGFTQLLKYFPGGRSRGQDTGWCNSAPLKSDQTILEDGEHYWVSYTVQRKFRERKRERGSKSKKHFDKKPSHCQNINPKPRFGQICSCLTFSMRSGLNLSILGNSWWMQCNKVLINTCPALRLIWRRINGGLSTFIFSNYGRWLYL